MPIEEELTVIGLYRESTKEKISKIPAQRIGN